MNTAVKLMLAAALASTCVMCSLAERLSLEPTGAGAGASSPSAGGEGGAVSSGVVGGGGEGNTAGGGGGGPVNLVWTLQTSGTNEMLWSVHFADAMTGWAVGIGGTIIKTSDGGANWAPQTSGTMTGLRSVHFVDAMTG